MEECSSFFFRNKDIFVIEKTSFGLIAEFGGAPSWTKCCGSACAGLWERMRETSSETTAVDTAALFTGQVPWLWSVLICCCSPPLSSLLAECVVSACWSFKKACFVYICYGCTGLCGKGEGYILCSPSEGFPVAERRRLGRQMEYLGWYLVALFLQGEGSCWLT